MNEPTNIEIWLKRGRVWRRAAAWRAVHPNCGGGAWTRRGALLMPNLHGSWHKAARVRVRVSLPLLNYAHVVIPDCGRHYVFSSKAIDIRAQTYRITPSNAGHPFFALADEAGSFLLAFGVLNRTSPLEINRVLPRISGHKAMVGGDEFLCLHLEWKPPVGAADPLTFWLDTSSATWIHSLRGYAAEIRSREKIEYPYHPDAWAPVWCSWTAFCSSEMTEQSVLENAQIVRKLGLGSIILDDGRFLIRGPEGEYKSVNGLAQLCPACPEVRKHVAAETRRLLEWSGADGLKVDLFNCLPPFPCVSREHSHDIANSLGALEAVMSTQWAAALECNPNALFELKQDYSNARLACYGTMVRAGDTAYDADTNCQRCFYLQAYARCVHTDYLVTSMHTSPRAMALLMIRMLAAGVPTFGMNFTVMPDPLLSVIRAWIRFYNVNRGISRHSANRNKTTFQPGRAATTTWPGSRRCGTAEKFGCRQLKPSSSSMGQDPIRSMWQAACQRKRVSQCATLGSGASTGNSQISSVHWPCRPAAWL